MKKHKFLTIFISILVLLFLVHLGLRIFVEQKVFSKMGPGGEKDYKKWVTEEVIIDPSEIKAPPFLPETEKAAQNFREQWEELKERALDISSKYRDYLRSEDKPTTQLEALFKELPEMQPLLSAMEELSQQPDYEIEALAAGQKPEEVKNIPFPNFLSWQVTQKLFSLKSYKLLLEEDFSGALEHAEKIIRCSKTHKYSTIIANLIGIAGYSIGAKAWIKAVDDCDDPALLKKTLDQQNMLAPQEPFFDPDLDPSVLDNLGTIKTAHRYGIQGDIRGKTGRELWGEAFLVEARFREQLILPHLTDPKDIEWQEKMIQNNRQTSALFGGEIKNIKGLGYALMSGILDPVFYNIARPNFSEMGTRDRVSRAKFDLLRIHTAWKLFTLEKGEEPKTLEDLCPEYLPEPLIDHFSKAGEILRIDPFPYSIGPDQIDQKTNIFYDPTNGTLSLGDVFLKP